MMSVEVSVKQTFAWGTPERRYELTIGKDDAALSIPGLADCLRAPLSEWAALSEVLSQALAPAAKSNRKSPTPSAPNNGQPWNGELDARLRTRWDEGATVPVLAKEFGRTTGGLSSRLVKIGAVQGRDDPALKRR